MLAYIRRNRSLLVGLILIGLVLLFAGAGRLFWDVHQAHPLSAPPNRPPSFQHPLGTDRQGRDILAVMIVGTPLTFYIGLLAGFIGLVIGTLLALISAYYGGIVDAVIRAIVDVGLTIPPLLILILLAVSIKSNLTISQMALVVASLAWLHPTRTIRSQVLTLKERAFIQVARLSGAGSLRIIFLELMPNLLPYLMATFVGAVASAILASIGLEVIGLGEIEANTLGMTIYWVNYYAAILHGLWWWFLPPILIIVLIFVGLFAISAGLDELVNPRKRRAV
ncbi:ABC transporter permease [Thermorudis peleae]|uniref:ABC transporter permease n=1 Tax=Thermorudis peleae TaxID=1382356 RepID=UPI00056F05A5|nr:ABC transporter permease [Thermorudis peleae]MBX6755199.1 ABC transporter permease [Thermorudis peleae]